MAKYVLVSVMCVLTVAMAVGAIIGIVSMFESHEVNAIQARAEKRATFWAIDNGTDLLNAEGKRKALIDYNEEYHEKVLKNRDYIYTRNDEVRLVERLTKGKYTVSSINSKFRRIKGRK